MNDIYAVTYGCYFEDTKFFDSPETAKEFAFRLLLDEHKEELIELYLERISNSLEDITNYEIKPQSFFTFLNEIVNDSDELEGRYIKISKGIPDIITMDNIDKAIRKNY
jgi:hypothetical protein